MPSRPPKLRPEPQRQAWGHGGKARQQRGYDRAHERMRELLMREVVVCEACRRSGRVTLGTIADHVKPLAHGGSGNHLGWTVRAARHRHEQGELPTFTMGAGRTVYALRSTLAKHFARLEREVR